MRLLILYVLIKSITCQTPGPIVQQNVMLLNSYFNQIESLLTNLMNQSKIQVVSQSQLLNGMKNASKLTLTDDPLVHLKKEKELLTTASNLLSSASQLKIGIKTAITQAQAAKDLATAIKLKSISIAQTASLCNNNRCHGSQCIINYTTNDYTCNCNIGFTGIIK